MKVIIFYGAPWTFNDIHIHKIIDQRGLVYTSFNDIIRSHIREETLLGNKILEFINAGKMAPIQLVEEVLRLHLSHFSEDGTVVLANYPHTIEQASSMEQALDTEISLVVYLKMELVEAEKISLAMAKKLGDSDTEYISNQVRTYQSRKEPIIKYFEQMGKKICILDHSLNEQLANQFDELILSIS